MSHLGAHRLGLTIPVGGQIDDPAGLRAMVEHGYSDLWSAETARFDAFTPLAAAAPAVPRTQLGTAIASVYARGPALLAMSAAAIAGCAPGRFVLGIGASSPVLTQDWNAAVYDRPVEKVRDTTRFLRAALSGELVDRQYDTFAVRRFRLDQPPEIAPPILIAALRPAMLRLAAAEADGALLNWLGATDVRTVRGILGRHATIGARIFVCCSSDEHTVRAAARRLIAGYLTVPAYAAQQRWLGRGDAMAGMWTAWAAGDRKAAAAAIPDETVDELIIHGPVEACAERLHAYRRAGVDIPIVKLLPLDPGREQASDATDLAVAYQSQS